MGRLALFYKTIHNNTHKMLDNTQYCVYNIIKGKRFMKGVDEKMKTSELIKLLKQAGFKKSGEGGNHTEFLNPTTGKKIYVWRHKKEVPTGTANKILKDAGLK